MICNTNLAKVYSSFISFDLFDVSFALFRSWRRRGQKADWKLCELAPALILGALTFKGFGVLFVFVC